MQIDVEALNHLKRRMKVTLPAEKVEQEFSIRLKKQAQEAKLKGFRPGKVPLEVVQQYYGAAIRQEVLDELIRSSFYEAITEKNIEIAGMPSIEPKTTIAGAPFEYEATFEVYPEIILQNLKGVKIKKLQAEITDADVEKILQKLRKQNAKWNEVERPAAVGDKINMDFEGTINEEKFAGGSAKGIDLELGSGRFIPGFEEGLTGKSAGEQVDLHLQFPKEYPQPDLAGKEAKFAVKINKVMTAELPEVNDEFAKNLDVPEGAAALQAEIKQNMERELKRNLQEQLKREVIAQLIQRNPIEVPESLIEAEIEQMQQNVKQRMGLSDKKSYTLPKEHFYEEAKKRVTVGLLFGELIKKENMTADQKRVKETINEVAAAYDNPEQIASVYYQNKKLLQQIEALILEEQVVDKLLENAEIEVKQVSYEEAINGEALKD